MFCSRLFRLGAALLGAVVGVSCGAAQELVLNPFFADNNYGATQFNLSNVDFSGNVANCAAFGVAQETDLVYGADFGPVPPVGNTKIGLHTQNNGNNDRVSMTLASGVGAGTKVRLRFWSVHINPTRVLVGISNSPTAFGSEIYRVDTTAGWTFNDVVVTLPQGGAYLTIQPDPAFLDGYAQLTGFSLMPVNAVRPVSAVARPREIRSGDRSLITVTLNGNAPAGGAVVFINYSAPALLGPGAVVVPAGRRSVTFTVIGNNGASTTRKVDLRLSTANGQARTYVLVRGAGH